MNYKNFLNKISNIFLVILLIFLIFLLLIIFINKYNNDDKVLSIGGYSIFKVISGSMIPTLEIGDYVLVKESNNYQVGDIITYKCDETYVTHRIIELNNNKVITKGDANTTEDSPFNRNQIKGKYVMTLTLFAMIYNKYFIGGFITFVVIINIANWGLKKIRREK